MQLNLRIYTHNIRYATSTPAHNELLWPHRAPRIASSIALNTSHAGILCLQEVLHNQLVDVCTALGAGYAYVGVGRDDGVRGGEYCPVFYHQDVWVLDRWRSVWLSETPDVPSRGWDAASVRLVTVAWLTHWESGRGVVVLNTHLDDQGVVARRMAARMIVGLVTEVMEVKGGEGEEGAGYGRGRGVVVVGDMNSSVGGEAYGVLTAPGSGLRDAAGDVPDERRYGHQNTYSGFGNKDEVAQRIDFVFVAGEVEGEGGWKVKEYGVLENKFEDGVYSSDHRPVVADLILL